MVSSQTQHLLAAMLLDKGFVDYYIVENKRRLQERYNVFVLGLAQFGIKHLEGNEALFCWVNMSHLLPSKYLEGEVKLWKKI